MQTATLNYAPIGKRFLAAFIDYFIYFMLCYAYASAFGEPEIQPDGSVKYVIHGFLALLPIIVWFLFFPILEGAMGQTFGKKMLGLKVILLNHKYDFGIMEALKRRFTDVIELAFLGIPALLAIKNSPQHQRLGDIWAKTTVVLAN